MKQITIAGRVTKDADIRQAGNDNVCGFSVAVDDRQGREKTTLFFECSLWGKRGDSLAPFLLKGTPVTVSGDLSRREHDGKTYLGIRVDQVTLQGGKKASDADEGYSGPAGRATASASGLDDPLPF
jgi:single-strand DNA-binding protein